MRGGNKFAVGDRQKEGCGHGKAQQQERDARAAFGEHSEQSLHRHRLAARETGGHPKERYFAITRLR